MPVKYCLFIILIVLSTDLFAQRTNHMVELVESKDTTYAQIPDGIDVPGMNYRYVEHMPEPAVDIDSFISAHLQYPADAKAMNKQGRVLVAFAVDETGNVKNVRVSRSIHPSLDKEAVRLIQSLPKWKPGSEKGKNISVEFSLPVAFKL